MHKNYLPEIHQSHSTHHLESKYKQKIQSSNSSIEWDQLINTSIQNSVKIQVLPKASNALNLSKLVPSSDVSYLKSTKRNFAKLGTSIYKDPELQQTKYDKNMQSFYSTLYRKSSSRLPFNTNLEKEPFSGRLLDFTEILSDNKKATGLQRYFSEILKLEMQQSHSEKEMVPPNRQQAIDLKEWLFMMITFTKQESPNINTRELAERIQLIYASCLRELIKQVSIECTERGELLQVVWDFYVELIGQIIKCYSEQSKESEKSYLEQMQRIQAFHDTQMETQKVKYQEYQDQIQKIRNESSDSVDELNLTKAKMLLLTADMRQLLQTNEAQKKEIDSLLLQIMLLRTQDQSDKKQENQTINVNLSQGQSIVSHLLNFKETNTEYKFKKSRVKNTNFEKFEQLRQQELQLKSELIDQQILEPDIEYNDQEVQADIEYQQEEIQTDLDMMALEVQEQKLQEQEVQIQNLEQQKEQLNQEIENHENSSQRENQQSDQKQNLLEAQIQQALQLIQDSSIDSKQLICEILNQSISQSQQLSQRIATLEREDTRYKIELLEKEDFNQELESKLSQAVADFIDIIKKKKKQINTLLKQKSTLLDTLNQVSSSYNIQINLPEFNDEMDMSQQKDQEESQENFQEFEQSQNLDQDNDDIKIDEQDELEYQFTDRTKIQENEQENKIQQNNNQIRNNEDFETGSQQQFNQYQNNLDQSLRQNTQTSQQNDELQAVDQIKINQNNDKTTNKNQKNQLSNPQNNDKNKKQKNVPPLISKNQLNKTEIDKKSQINEQNQNSVDKKNIEKNNYQNSSSQMKQNEKPEKSFSQHTKQDTQQQSQSNSKQNQQKKQVSSQEKQHYSNSNIQKQEKERTNEKNSSNDLNQGEQQLQVQNKEQKDQNYSINQNPQFSKKRNSKVHNQEKSITMTQNDESLSEDLDLESSQIIQNNPQGERIKQVVNQYKDQKPKIKNKYNLIVLEPKNQKRFRRIYSQNTDVANNLLNDLKSRKKQNKKIQFSILQLQKLVLQILSDICKQAEGYKIPFHVCIYDYFKNKYGFKQVAEKKIKQVYQFIYYEKDSHIKVKLLAQFCYLIGEMDEIGQKLLTESYQFFSQKNDLNYGKVELLLNYEQVSEFLSEKSQRWLSQQQIQQMLHQYRNQQQNNQRYYINHDSLLLKILECYYSNKKDQQTTLESLFNAADLDGNKLIEFSEFKTLHRALHQDKLSKTQLLQIFTNNADFQDENGDKMLTLPRFTEMSIELGIFQKEHVLKYSEGSEELKNKWEKEKSNIKYRFLRAKKFQKVRHTFQELENQIKNQEKDKQTTLWVSFKLLNEESQRVLQNYETNQCLFELLPELQLIMYQNKVIEQLE
ncbi:unnamed protein product (macronuclear) [Paramecium tetraurelia]|uniref:EF-hand domain-containing protein n=1 Tax=Paramecium tetraurelia TaxID=5888 RepID=A0CWQ6_PARTE|nr:uncharacterized protein GSPATT00001426001 [Paramecium tetraurelia]CAK75223.1 unnamed protein product [Paramecium tetraurelia]|eukprot:XP_001442620.1 hypothetical protein (macronuclear) [Paramecium tetraurelia strain d4-2]